MDIALTVLGVLNILFSLGLITLIITIWRWKTTKAIVQLQSVFDSEGKHYHSFGMTAQAGQKPGYYCACGTRAPERMQPSAWRAE